jgi:hypothetical protein
MIHFPDWVELTWCRTHTQSRLVRGRHGITCTTTTTPLALTRGIFR